MRGGGSPRQAAAASVGPPGSGLPVVVPADPGRAGHVGVALVVGLVARAEAVGGVTAERVLAALQGLGDVRLRDLRRRRRGRLLRADVLPVVGEVVVIVDPLLLLA